MERAARSEGRSAWVIAAEHAEHFLADLERLNIELPDVMPRAAGDIPAGLIERIRQISPRYAESRGYLDKQIALIQRLEAKGVTYRTEDGIYFDTSRFPEYGRLARIQVEGLQEGARVEMGGKRHKTDFALWKFSPRDVKRQMEWDSPWGRGFPGWHIECSAMAMDCLHSDTIDIHTGGTDHIPVHHTNEIAQSEMATGQSFVRYWLHGEFLLLGEDQRMGKSEGNLITLQDLIDQGFEPMAYRYLVLNTHYRKFLNFSWEAMQAAQEALKGLRSLLKEVGIGRPHPPRDDLSIPEEGPGHDLFDALCDDLNTAKALGVLWTVFGDKTLSADTKQELAVQAESVLSLNLFDYRASGLGGNIIDATGNQIYPLWTPREIRELAESRIDARTSRRFEESDRIREELRKRGWEMRDSRDGYELVALRNPYPSDVREIADRWYIETLQQNFETARELKRELRRLGWDIRWDIREDYPVFPELFRLESDPTFDSSSGNGA
jgi:cysteinyl-tRNA synthetase